MQWGVSVMDWSRIQYFTPEEFDDSGFPGSGEEIDLMTVWILELLRRKTGWPIVVLDAVDVEGVRHSRYSCHNLKRDRLQASAVDFWFKTKAGFRDQARAVLLSGFTGIGVYQGWAHPGFHGDRRARFQVWKRSEGKYTYLLS